MSFAKWRHFNRIVNYKCRLNIFTLCLLAKYFINKLPFTHRFILLNTQFFTNLTQLIFIHSVNINAGVIFNGINHCNAFVGSLKIYLIFANLHLCCAKHFQRNMLKHLLGKLHHPFIIGVCNINLHHRKLRIVSSIHSLISKISRELIHTIKATYYQTFQVKLVSNP